MNSSKFPIAFSFKDSWEQRISIVKQRNNRWETGDYLGGLTGKKNNNAGWMYGGSTEGWWKAAKYINWKTYHKEVFQ